MRRRAGRPRQEPEEAPEKPTPPVPVEITVDELAEKLTTADLDALVSALPDEALGHIVLAGLRQLRRRHGRKAGQGSRGAKGRGASALESIAREVAAVLGGTGEEF